MNSLVVTNPEGARRVRERDLPDSVVIGEVEEGDAIGARGVLSAVGRVLPGKIVLVAGKRFGPEHPLWGTLSGVKRADSHLFLRYSFTT